MAYSVKILADSIGPACVRLTTMEVTFPRLALAELNTHRRFSRNSASSRAIPVAKMLRRVREEPFTIVHWGANRKGMQASEQLAGWRLRAAHWLWWLASKLAVVIVWLMSRLGLHKQVANRLLEPFLWHTAIITATEWENFFHLRNHKDAQPEIRVVAEMMEDAYARSTPRTLQVDEWHLPLIHDVDESDAAIRWPTSIGVLLARVSCARCARVSYLTHDGKRDMDEDLQLAGKLQVGGHMSPFEHAAQALPFPDACGNLVGWRQYRKLLPNEAIFPRAVPAAT